MPISMISKNFTSYYILDRIRFFEPKSELTPFRVEINNNLFCGQVHKYDSDNKEYTEYDAYACKITHNYVSQ